MTKPILIRRELLIEKHDGSHFNIKNKYVNNINLSRNTKYWLDEEGHFHRDNDKPAIISDMGSRHWYQHGKIHRDGGKPAIIYCNGEKMWYQYGRLIKEV